MSFWGNWSWLYFIGLVILAIGIIGYNIFKYEASCRMYEFFSTSIGIGVVVTMLSLLVFSINFFDYCEQKELYESKYNCIVNFTEENKELMETNKPDLLKRAVEINEKYFEIVDGEMKIRENSFRYIKDDSWRGLVPINTNELSGKKCINKQ